MYRGGPGYDAHKRTRSVVRPMKNGWTRFRCRNDVSVFSVRFPCRNCTSDMRISCKLVNTDADIFKKNKCSVLIRFDISHLIFAINILNCLIRGETVLCIIIHNFSPLVMLNGRSQWPRGLTRGSAAVRLLGLWVRIPP
jgi:hypothetical protein